MGNNENEFGTKKKKLTKEERKKRNRIFNIFVYIIAGILIITGVTILVKEMVLITDDNTDGLVSEQDYLNNVYAVTETFTPLATPVSDYDIIPVQIHFINARVNGERKNVSCNLYATGIGDDGVMETVSSAKDASWLSVDPYVVPGDVGNCVIAGHNLWKKEAGTFSILKSMQVGDSVAVTFDKGFTRYFEVVDLYESEYNDPKPMETDVDEPILTLVTCKGNWDATLEQSKTRVVAICKLISH